MTSESGTAVVTGAVWLVAAGPGDPQLMTVRGADVLATAEVVVSDADVLDLAEKLAPDAEIVAAVDAN